MVGTYYFMWLPYRIAWLAAKALRRKKLVVLHVEDSFDYLLFANIKKHLADLPVVVSSSKIISRLESFLDGSTKIYRYPWCFPDAVIMFRNAAWKYPVKRIVKIRMAHGPYHFKRYPKAYYFNMFNLNLQTSHQDVAHLRALGVNNLKAIGYPRSDDLFNGSYPNSLLEDLKTKLGIDRTKPTLFFSATWDGSGMSAIDKWYNKLSSLVAQYNILVTLHPWMSTIYRDYLRNQDGIHLIETLDFYPYLLISDVCISDTTSLIAEICVVDRPIITFRINPTKRTPDEIIKMIASISIRIGSFDELPNAIIMAMKTAEFTSAERRKVISTLIDPLDGKAGLRAAQEIIKLIPEAKP